MSKFFPMIEEILIQVCEEKGGPNGAAEDKLQKFFKDAKKMVEIF